MSIYETHTVKEGRLPFVFHDLSYKRGQDNVRSNWHENLELLYVISGVAQVTSNEKRVTVSAGELAVINANHIHFLQTVKDVRVIVLIVDRSFCLANHFDTDTVCFKPHVCDCDIGTLFTHIIEEYKDENTPYRIPLLRARILMVLALLLSRHIDTDRATSGTSHHISSIKLALGYIHAEYTRALTLDEVAAVAGLSKYYFTREFSKVTGMSFITYLNAFRCEKAKSLLLEKKGSIENVAYALGFSSASYFNRIFKRFVGMRPSDYIAEQLRGPEATYTVV